MHHAENAAQKIEIDCIFDAGKAPRMYPQMEIQLDQWTKLAMGVYGVPFDRVTTTQIDAVKAEARKRMTNRGGFFWRDQ